MFFISIDTTPMDARAGPSTRDELNDSDDAFVFKNPNLKRKIKPVSPRVRKKKAPDKNELSKSVSSQPMAGQSTRKPPLNKSAPTVASVRNSKRNKSSKGQSTLSPYFSKDDKPNESAQASEVPPKNVQTSTPTVEILDDPLPLAPIFRGTAEKVETRSLTDDEATAGSSSGNIDGSSSKKSSWDGFPVLRTPPKIESFACPLCKKKFEKSSLHVSHVKQCAKKKKIPTVELLSILDGSKSQVTESDITVIQKAPSAVENKNDAIATEDLALAAALSLSLSESSGPGTSGRVDKRIVDSQRTTLERYGFTSSSNATGVPRRRKMKRVGTPILTIRSAEERTRLLTEKAAVILLSQQEECTFSKRLRSAGDPEISSQFPYVAQDNRLWDLGESAETTTWYLHEMRPYISPEKPPRQTECEKSPDVSQVSDENNQRTIETESSIQGINGEVIESKKGSSSLADDWSRFVGSSELSDAVVETVDGEVPVHSLVLAVRCPGVTIAQLANACLTVTSATLLDCLNFIYTGTWKPTEACDMDDVLTVARVLGRQDLTEIVSPSVCSNSNDVIPSSVSPKEAECQRGGFEIIAHTKIRELVLKEAMDADGKPLEDPLELADTEPVQEFEVADEPMEAHVDEVVDLTQCGSGSTTASYGDDEISQKLRQSVFDMIPESNEPSMEDSRNELCVDQYSSQPSAKEVQEREVILNVSKNSSSIDLFENDESPIVSNDAPEADKPDSNELVRPGVIQFNSSQCAARKSVISSDDDVRILTAPPPKTTEIITVSSDSESNGDSDDALSDEVSVVPKKRSSSPSANPTSSSPLLLEQPAVPISPPHAEEEAPDLPYHGGDGFDSFWEPPENDVNDAVIEYPATPSQSLVLSREPRTPRKVLESPTKSDGRRTPVPPEGDAEMQDSPLVTTPKSSGWSELKSKILRKSIARSRVSWTTRTSLGRRNSRVGFRKSRRSGRPSILSESVVNALDEPFFDEEEPVSSAPVGPIVRTLDLGTPSLANRPFVEVTPCITPSTKMVDNSSPRPRFSAMKTGSIKKHLQKYGLKKSLGKVKARKILKHFYDELHPVVNTVTGKLVKFLPKDEVSTRGGKSAGRGGKASGRGRSKAGVNRDVASVTNEPQPSTSKITTLTASLSCEAGPSTQNHSSSSGASSDESGIDGGEFDHENDDVATQACSTNMTVREAVKKYIEEHKSVHQDVLTYTPVWVEKFRTDLQQYLKVKFKLTDIMTCLDQLCISFRSEAQAASNKRRNERKASRRGKRKAPVRKKS